MTHKILLVDDHAIVLDGLQALLQTDPEIEVVAKLNSGNFALAHIRSSSVSILITDYSMPDMNGLELVKQAKALDANLKIIVLSMHDETHLVHELIRAGIDGYILKKYTHQELLQAVNVVKHGGQYWSPEINKILIKGISKIEETSSITDRELQVLKLLIDECTSREIAEKLFISTHTVNAHRKNILRKANAKTPVELVRKAIQEGWI